MKKLLLALNVSALLLLSNNALAANRNVVFAGYSFGQDISYAYAGGATAINGNIDKDDFLLRIGGAFGQYNYSTTAFDDQHVRGQISSTDLMLGYQKNLGSYGLVTVYGGVTYDNYKLNKGDNSSRVAGGKTGAKGQFELFLTPTKHIVLTNISNYSSAYNSYWSRTTAGWNFGDFVFGPEITFLGNRSFNQQRYGGRFSQIKLGFVEMAVAAGYMRSNGFSAGDDGAYTSIEFASKF